MPSFMAPLPSSAPRPEIATLINWALRVKTIKHTLPVTQGKGAFLLCTSSLSTYVKILAMFKKQKSLILALFLVLMLPLFFADAAGTPSIMSYQGRLTDASGNLLGTSSGTPYYFKFSIWNVSTGGTAGTNRLWPSSDPTAVTLTVRSGVFSANIGDSGYDALNFDFNTEDDIFLQVEVSSDNVTFQTLDPRQRITAAPFAKVSGAVNGTGASSFGTVTPFALPLFRSRPRRQARRLSP